MSWTKYVVIIELVIFLTIIFFTATLAYEEGLYDGLKEFCQKGTIYKNDEGGFKCVVSTNEPDIIQYDNLYI